MLDGEADTGSQLDLSGDRCGSSQGHEGIQRVRILPGQVPLEGVWREAAGRNVRVLGHPEGFEPTLLHGNRQAVEGHGVIRTERKDSDIHYRS